jgi:hypothetical protein
MIDGIKIVHKLSKMLGNYEFSYIDVVGRSEGNMNGWRKCSFYLTNSWAFSTSLGTTLSILDLGKELTLLNIYGPFLDRVEYWDKVFNIEWI